MSTRPGLLIKYSFHSLQNGTVKRKTDCVFSGGLFGGRILSSAVPCALVSYDVGCCIVLIKCLYVDTCSGNERFLSYFMEMVRREARQHAFCTGGWVDPGKVDQHQRSEVCGVL